MTLSPVVVVVVVAIWRLRVSNWWIISPIFFSCSIGVSASVNAALTLSSRRSFGRADAVEEEDVDEEEVDEEADEEEEGVVEELRWPDDWYSDIMGIVAERNGKNIDDIYHSIWIVCVFIGTPM